MQLLTRTVHLTGPFGDASAYCVEVAELVSDKIQREVAVWAGSFGVPLGTYTFALRTTGLADVMTWLPGLEADPQYQAKTAEGAAMSAAPPEGQMSTVLHGQLGEEAPPVGSFAVVTQAVIANGMYEQALGWCVDIAQHVEKITGMPALFMADGYGPFGQVTWIQPAPDAAAVDAATEAVNNDPDYLAKLGEAGDLFVPASGQQALIMRIG
ncbi:MAG: hypothetical protein HKN41_12750 [Ilumatobacter sp.]|nr:hypothetical protein [Ilumatobacter sp.]